MPEGLRLSVDENADSLSIEWPVRSGGFLRLLKVGLSCLILAACLYGIHNLAQAWLQGSPSTAGMVWLGIFHWGAAVFAVQAGRYLFGQSTAVGHGLLLLTPERLRLEAGAGRPVQTMARRNLAFATTWRGSGVFLQSMVSLPRAVLGVLIGMHRPGILTMRLPGERESAWLLDAIRRWQAGVLFEDRE